MPSVWPTNSDSACRQALPSPSFPNSVPMHPNPIAPSQKCTYPSSLHQQPTALDRTVPHQPQLSLHSLLGATPTSCTSLAIKSCLLIIGSEGTSQLLTPHHHRRTRLPTLAPLNCAVLFQCRQPERRRVQSVPWIRGRRTCQAGQQRHRLQS